MSVCSIIIHAPRSIKCMSHGDTEHWESDSWHSEITQCLVGLLKWRGYYVLSKHQEPLIHQHGITTQNIWIFRNTVHRTSNLECLYLSLHQTRSMKCPSAALKGCPYIYIYIYCTLPAIGSSSIFKPLLILMLRFITYSPAHILLDMRFSQLPYEDYCLLECDTIYSGEPAHWNACTHLQGYTTSHPWWQ